jgi:hypothetical protein
VPAAPRNRIQQKPNNLFILFLRIAQAPGEFIPTTKPTDRNSLPLACPEARRPQPYFVARSSTPLAQFHPRNMPCARKRAVQPNQRELLFSSLPICAVSSAQYAIACRNRGAQSHSVPLASGRRRCI